jgi:iron(III) transport system substrate-binding protein
MFRISSLLLVGVLAGLVFTGCSSGGGDNLTVYSGRTEDLVAPILSDFEKESGIDVDVRYGTSAELAVLIDTEGDKGPDVFLSQSPGAMGYLDGKGRLIKLDAATLDRVPERFRAEDGDWVGLSGRVRIVVYNADKTDEADVPDSALDFTDPKYKGKFGVAPTNGSFQDFVTVMRSQRGDEATLAWLEGIKANGARTYENNIAVREAVARGEIDFGLINHYYNERAKAEDPATPTENHFLNNQDAGAAILATTIGILNTADEKQAANAQKLVTFLLSEKAQKYFAEETFEYPLAAGVEPASDLPDLEALVAPDVDLSALGGELEKTRDLIRDSGLEGS